MYLERLLQINMATLAALGALLLGMGQRSEGPPLLVALAAAVSVWLTDVNGWFRLGRRAANLLMLLAAAVALRDLFPLGNELQALGFAWLLIYLQIILLFQKKDEQIYWLLVILSLLQVVVASLFGQGIGFGMLLMVYMLLGFSAMTLLMMHRQWEKHRPAAGSEVGIQDWEPAFTCLPGGGSQAGIGRHLLRLLGRMGFATLGLTVVLFFAVPRFEQFTRRGVITRPQTMVGFTDNVTLGELGRLIESREQVMRVRFFRETDHAPQPVQGDIYLQGAILMTYQQGHWHTGQPSLGFASQWLQKPERLPDPFEIVRQTILIEGMDRDELFFVAPYFPLAENAEIEVDCARKRLQRLSYRSAGRFEYALGTTAIVKREQSPLVPAEPDTAHRGCGDDYTQDSRDMPQGKDALPKLTALAKRWIDESKLPESDQLGRARYLERKLAASEQFQYSLVGQNRDPDLDPIEDFVTKHPVGHCEYFSTALTLMLRSQGIRARMVSGFKCNREDWDNVGGYYLVRQFHAHTWVEAYLPHSQIPPDMMHAKEYWDNWRTGGWLRLDPTPAGAAKERNTGWFTPIRRNLDWFDSLWANYVVELDMQRQRDAIYQPIANALRSAWRELTSPDRWQSVFNSVSVAFYLDHLNREVRWILLGLLLLLAAALLAGAGWLAQRVERRLVAMWTGSLSRQGGRRGTEVEFYRRFERLLAPWGATRGPAQTQREFAAAAGARLAALTGESRLETLALAVADAFYHVRFGQLPLDSLQAETVEHALLEIADCRKRRRRPAAVLESKKS